MGIFRLIKKGVVAAAVIGTIAYFGDQYNVKPFIDENILGKKSGIEEIVERDSKPPFRAQYDALNSKLNDVREGFEKLIGYR